jgi:hypothetical protein
MSTPSVEQQRSSAGRTERIHILENDAVPQASQHLNPPVNPPGTGLAPMTDPDMATSPMRADGLAPTTGLAIAIHKPLAAVHGTTGLEPTTAAGFTLTVWVRDPVTRWWAKTTPFSIPYGQWFRTFDLNGGDLYFQFDVSTFAAAGPGMTGAIDVTVVEL